MTDTELEHEMRRQQWALVGAAREINQLVHREGTSHWAQATEIITTLSLATDIAKRYAAVAKQLDTLGWDR